MAIYHLSASIVKRSAGRSVTAAAAYRAGSKIEDLTTGIVHDYTRKQGVDYSEIISPVSIDKDSNEWLLDREQLWNKVEEIEKRRDAQLAREVTIAIPVELDRASQIELVREYVRANFVDRGMIADINIHHLDGNNPHGHILLTMRNLQTNSKGEIEFGLKNTDWNSKDLLLAQRKSWEEITNKYLAAAGSEAKIDCRSLEEQGSPFIPQIHIGVHAMAMKRKGIDTDRGNEFDRIEAENNDIRANLERIYREEAAPESEPEPEPELGKLVHEMIPLDCKKSLKFGEYRVQRGYEDYIQVSTNLYGTKILELTRENDQWSTNIVNPNNSRHTKKYYSPDYISELVSDFKRCVRHPTELESQKFSNEIKSRYNSEFGQVRYYPVPKLYSKNENEHKLGKLLDELLQKWGQRIFHPEDIKLVFYKIQPDQISIYIDEHPPQSTRISSFKFIDDQWINTVQPKDDRYSIDNLITIVSDQHHRFDTGEIKKLELTDLERREIRWFRDWCGLELNDNRLAVIRERGKEIISDSLADDLVRWINEKIPVISKILYKDETQEILAGSARQQHIIIRREDRSNSVYTHYRLTDTQENKSLEIRHNRNRLEMISGVVTPLIAEQIKIITNELENPEEVTSDIDRQTSNLTSPPKVKSDDVVNQINLILQTLANQVEEKLEKPETIKFKPAIEKPESEFKPTSEDLKSVIVESDPVIEEEQPIEVAKINQPTIKRAAKTKTRRPDQGRQ